MLQVGQLCGLGLSSLGSIRTLASRPRYRSVTRGQAVSFST